MKKLSKEEVKSLKEKLKTNLSLNLQILEILLKEEGFPNPTESSIYRKYEDVIDSLDFSLDLDFNS